MRLTPDFTVHKLTQLSLSGGFALCLAVAITVFSPSISKAGEDFTSVAADQGSLQLMPDASSPSVDGSYNAVGFAGGPFNPSLYDALITNTSQAQTWSYTASENIFGMSIDGPASGTIPPNTTIGVRIRPNASAPFIEPGGERTGTMTINVDRPLAADLTFTYNLRIRALKRTGDDFLQAVSLGDGDSLITSGRSNQFYSLETGEPLHQAGQTNQTRSYWFRWRAPKAGQFRAFTSNTNWDPILSVYRSREDSLKSVRRIVQITSDDNSGNGTDPMVYFNTTAGTDYYFAVVGRTASQFGTFSFSIDDLSTGVGNALVASTLPSARGERTNNYTTTFATIINTSNAILNNCGVEMQSDTRPYSEFSFQTVDNNNAPVGFVNRRVNLLPGASQGFVVSYRIKESTYSAITPTFDCSNSAPAERRIWLNGALVYTDAPIKPADMVAVAVTSSGDGILNIPNNDGLAAFPVSVVNNNGVNSNITVEPAKIGAVNANLTVCRTNTATGACLAPPTPTFSLLAATNVVYTFTVFAQGTGLNQFDPVGRRILVNFRRSGGGQIVGRTSVAVRTQLTAQ